MRPEDLREFNRQQPFEPYCIYVTGGQIYDTQHPDQWIVLRSRAITGIGDDGGISERVEHAALIHIIRIEELQAEAAAG